MNLRVFRPVLLACAIAFCGSPLHAAVHLPPIFSDHMVLQRSTHTPIWGSTGVGRKVRVSIGGVAAECLSDAQGNWRLEMDLSQLPAGPSTLQVSGDSVLKISDVMIGDVWLCSGQSNMGWLMKDTVAVDEERSRPANPNLRQFTVDKQASLSPLREIGGKWMIAQPSTVGAFSAVAYYFGKTVSEATKSPVGLIHSSWGGTPIESWMSPESMASDSALVALSHKEIGQFQDLPSQKKRYIAALAEFEDRFTRHDRKEATADSLAASNAASADGWHKIELPGSYPPTSTESAAGALWLRKTIAVSELAGPAGLSLYLGAPGGFEQVYWNGQKIGEMTPQKLSGSAMPRTYTVPGKLIRVGDNVLAVRLFLPVGPLIWSANAGEFRFSTIAPLGGEWEYRWEYEFPYQAAAVDHSSGLLPAFVPEIQQIPTSLFNAKIAPLVGYGIRGIAWYQGESNAGDGSRYRARFQALIEDWRLKWKSPDLPFVFCQLANFKGKVTTPGDSSLAELREAQADALRMPATGMAVLMDVGEEDVHFRDKREAGRRLGLAALRVAYAMDVVASAPEPVSARAEGGVARIHFDVKVGELAPRELPATYVVTSSANVIRPLIRNSPASQIEGFQIAGPDGLWEWADARIDGSDVVVQSAKVLMPAEVRYAWSDNPTCNLYCSAGLPVAPFRIHLATESAAERDQRMRWWRDSRFGMFIHWGLYAVPAGNWQGKPVAGIGEWIMLRGKIPVQAYAALAPQFNPVKFDALKWVQAAKRAGMKYIVITAKHHDGFAMFKSAVDGYNIVDATPFGRDPLAEMAAACHREGIKLGFYYSQAQDWHHPGGAAREGGHWDPVQDGNMDDYLRRIAVPQVRELLSNYGPVSVLWWDTPADMTPSRAAPFSALLKLQPGIVTNNRLGGGYFGDVDTPEQKIPAAGFPSDWETCMTMNGTWGYKTDDHDWKSAKELVRNLIDIASKGGNFLLNVGPTAEGEMPHESLDRLKEIGDWMAENGEAIYGTTASPFRRLEWGRITRKGSILYLCVFNWPKDGWLTVPMRHAEMRASFLRSPGESLETRWDDAGLQVHLLPGAPDAIATVIKLEGVGPVDPLPLPAVRVSGEAALQLGVDEALLKGGVRVESDAIVLNTLATTNWRLSTDEVRWTVHFDKPGRFRVVVDYAAPSSSTGSNFLVSVGSELVPGKAVSTGMNFKRQEIGIVAVEREGDAEVTMKPVRDLDRDLMNLRSLELSPVK